MGRSGDKETYTVTRPVHRLAALAGAALLVGLAVVACGGRDRGRAVPTAGTLQTQNAVTSASPSGLPSDGASSSVSGSPTASQTAAISPALAASTTPTPTPTAPPTPDAVASELDQIEQLINDIDGSLSDSDSSKSGGE